MNYDQGFSINNNTQPTSQVTEFYEHKIKISPYKVIRDPIFDRIEVEETAVRIIDTPEF